MPTPKLPQNPKTDKKLHSRPMMPHLERDKVLDASLELLNEVGFEGLTLRRVADRLGVKAAALYWHFENKQDLINHLAAQIFTREFSFAETELAGYSWRELLERMGENICSALMRYRDGAMVVASADLSNVKVAFDGRSMVIRELLRRGLPEEVIFTAMFCIVRYALGYVFEEQIDPKARKKGKIYMRNAAPLLLEEFPEATAKLIELYSALAEDSREQFRQGLALMLDGVEKKLTA